MFQSGYGHASSIRAIGLPAAIFTACDTSCLPARSPYMMVKVWGGKILVLIQIHIHINNMCVRRGAQDEAMMSPMWSLEFSLDGTSSFPVGDMWPDRPLIETTDRLFSFTPSSHPFSSDVSRRRGLPSNCDNVHWEGVTPLHSHKVGVPKATFPTIHASAKNLTRKWSKFLLFFLIWREGKLKEWFTTN